MAERKLGDLFKEQLGSFVWFEANQDSVVVATVAVCRVVIALWSEAHVGAVLCPSRGVGQHCVTKGSVCTPPQGGW